MNGKRGAVLLAVVSLVAACTYPVASVTTISAHPMLRISGAPSDAILIVDSKSAGPASAFGAGERALVLSHGTHRIEITRNSALLYSSDVYFGDDMTKTISLTPGAQ